MSSSFRVCLWLRASRYVKLVFAFFRTKQIFYYFIFTTVDTSMYNCNEVNNLPTNTFPHLFHICFQWVLSNGLQKNSHNTAQPNQQKEKHHFFFFFNRFLFMLLEPRLCGQHFIFIHLSHFFTHICVLEAA